EGIRTPEPGEGREAVFFPGPPDRREEDAGPERKRRRSRDEDRRGHRSEHGRGGGCMSGQGKRYEQATSAYDRAREYPPSDAIKILKGLPDAKFDETVEVAFRLGIDTRKQDQALRGTVALPHGTGKSVRVAVFAQGEKAREAAEAGADIVGAEELVEQVMKGEIDFDAAIASPDTMATVGKAGRVLGPR